METVSCKKCIHYICRTIFGQVIEPFCALGYPLEPCPDFEDETAYVASQLSNDVASMKQLQAENSLLTDALANYEQENLELVDRVAELEAALEIAYDHLRGAGYTEDGPTLTILSAALAGKEGER